MARSFFTVNPIRLSDPRLRGLSCEARLIWANLLVGELATKIPGVARGGALTVADMVGLEVAVAASALAELVGAGLVEADESARVLILDGIAEDHRRPAKSKQMVVSWARALADLPPSPAIARQIRRLRRLSPAKVLAEIADEWAEALRVHRVEEDTSIVPTRGPTEAPPRPHRGPTEAPDRPRGGGGRDPRSRSRSDLDLDRDQDPPSSPPGGTGRAELAVRVTAAAEHLGRERARLFDGYEPEADTVTPRLLAQVRSAPPEVVSDLERLCTRACLRRADELAKGRGDYRRLLTLEHIVRTANEYLRASYLDELDRPTARGDPGPTPYIRGPADADEF